MSEVNQSLTPATPAQAATKSPSADPAVDAYRRAVQARPTGFSENPIGAMASAMDKIGRAAGNLLGGKQPIAGQDGLADAEQRLVRANEAARANPGSLAAKQEQLKAALSLFSDMSKLAPNDPRRVKVAGFIVQLANGLGPEGLALRVPGMDVRGLLRLAAMVTSRFGDAAGMQSAFLLEGILKQTLPGTSVEAMQVLDQLIQRFSLSKGAAALIKAGWAIRLTQGGEMPNVDISSRTISLNAAQESPSLSVLARAYWHDTSLTNPADKDGFIAAFLKIANQGGFTVLNRKYRELRRMARHELSQSRHMSAVGGSAGAPVTALGARQDGDESGDMFAALAVFARSEDGQQLPDSVSASLARFYG